MNTLKQVLLSQSVKSQDSRISLKSLKDVQDRKRGGPLSKQVALIPDLYDPSSDTGIRRKEKNVKKRQKYTQR